MGLIVLYFSLILIVIVFLMTQLTIPLLTNKRCFSIFRSTSKVEKEILEKIDETDKNLEIEKLKDELEKKQKNIRKE